MKQRRAASLPADWAEAIHGRKTKRLQRVRLCGINIKNSQQLSDLQALEKLFPKIAKSEEAAFTAYKMVGRSYGPEASTVDKGNFAHVQENLSLLLSHELFNFTAQIIRVPTESNST